jgi:RHS repeat-associated protein
MEFRVPKGTTQASGTRYYSFNGETVAQRTGSGVTWLAADVQGTSQIAVTANDTQAVTRRRMTPYGEPRGKNPTWVNPKGFVGGDHDPTGLTHLGAREYDSGTGRFISVDPLQDLADPQQWNAYGYANNSPVTLTDPDGLEPRPWHNPAYTPDMCRNNKSKECHPAGSMDHVTPGWNKTTSSPSRGDGPSDDEVQKARHIQKKKTIDVILDVGGKVLMEFFGINDILNCVQKGDIKACGMTLIGALPFGRAFKAIASLPVLVRAGKAVVNFLQQRKWAQGILARADDGCHSFAPNTRVLMANGRTKKIKDVKLRDWVLATDPRTGRTAPKPVTTLFSHRDTLLTDVKVATPGGKTAVLRTTQNHQFWDRASKAWVKAADLKADKSQLTSPYWSRHAVLRINSYVGSAVMHDLTVDDIHTYYVVAGSTPVLVHNCDFAPGVADQKYDKHVLGLDDAGNPTGRADMPEYDYDGGFEQYEADAKKLMCNASCPAGARQAVRSSDGALIRLDSTGRLGIKRGDKITTFFRPDDPAAYFAREAAR